MNFTWELLLNAPNCLFEVAVKFHLPGHQVSMRVHLVRIRKFGRKMHLSSEFERSWTPKEIVQENKVCLQKSGDFRSTLSCTSYYLLPVPQNVPVHSFVAKLWCIYFLTRRQSGVWYARYSVRISLLLFLVTQREIENRFLKKREFIVKQIRWKDASSFSSVRDAFKWGTKYISYELNRLFKIKKVP